ncbi:MAG TPA: TonB-dependent receptor [Gemmatimonadaceae bacterium]|nr:TonB-dependent receptor [Gemmatimonadaceae bacterium]
MRSNRSSILVLVLALGNAVSARSQRPALHDPLSDSMPVFGIVRVDARSFGGAVTIIDSTEIASSHARTLSEFLTARVAGVSVLRSGGVEGEGSRVAIRGPRTLSLSPYPLLVVDGIRVDNTQEARTLDFDVYPSRLDDIPLADIAEIAILPGAVSASSFGPGGVNGAIAVTTKRSDSEGFHWRSRLGTRLTSVPDRFPANYLRTGTAPGGQPAITCNIIAVSQGNCIPSGLQSWNPLEQASPFRLGRALSGDGELSSGIGWFLGRAIVSGDRALGVTPDDDDGKFTGRLNLDQRPVRSVSISEHVGYQRSSTGMPMRGRWIDRSNVISNGLFGRAIDDSAHGYRDFPMLTTSMRQHASQTQLAIDGDWNPWQWLSVSAEVGHDHLDQHDEAIMLDPRFVDPDRTAGTFRHDLHTAEMVARSSYHFSPDLSSTTLLGLSRWTSQLFSNFSSPSTGVTLWSSWRATSPWLAQRVAWRERLSLGASLRSEQMTEPFFGALPRQLFKSFDVAWSVPGAGSRPPFRLRAAYGEGSQAPRSDPEIVARSAFESAPLIVASDSVERTVEREVGFDVNSGDLISLGLTVYSDNSSNLAFNPPVAPLPPGTPLFSYGSMRTTGVNAVSALKMIEIPPLRWDLTAGFSTIHNRVLSLGRSAPFVFQASRVQPGMPLSSYFGTTYSYSDVNGNGIIDPQEVLAASAQSFLGSGTPTREAFFRNVIALSRGLTLSATLDYRGGQKLWNRNEDLRCSGLLQCRGAQDPSAPLAEQAAFVAHRLDFTLDIENASFTRLREVALEWRVPNLALSGAHDARLSIAGLNLATWTHYRGLDPEVTAGWFDDEIRMDLGKSPIPRTVVVRLDLR